MKTKPTAVERAERRVIRAAIRLRNSMWHGPWESNELRLANLIDHLITARRASRKRTKKEKA